MYKKLLILCQVCILFILGGYSKLTTDDDSPEIDSPDKRLTDPAMETKPDSKPVDHKPETSKTDTLFSASARFMKRAVKKEYEQFNDADYDQYIPVSTTVTTGAHQGGATCTATSNAPDARPTSHVSPPFQSTNAAPIIEMKPTNPFSSEYSFEEPVPPTDLSPESQDEALLIDSAFTSAPFLRKKQKKKKSMHQPGAANNNNPIVNPAGVYTDVFAAAPFSGSNRSTPASIKTSSSTTSPPMITSISPPIMSTMSPTSLSPQLQYHGTVHSPPLQYSAVDPRTIVYSPPQQFKSESQSSSAIHSPQLPYQADMQAINYGAVYPAQHQYSSNDSQQYAGVSQNVHSPPLLDQTKSNLDLFGCADFNNSLQCTDFNQLSSHSGSRSPLAPPVAVSASGSTHSPASVPISPTENLVSTQEMSSTNPFLVEPFQHVDVFQSTPKKPEMVPNSHWQTQQLDMIPIWQSAKPIDSNGSESDENDDEGMAELLHDKHTSSVDEPDSKKIQHKMPRTQQKTVIRPAGEGTVDTSFSNMSFMDDGEKQNNQSMQKMLGDYQPDVFNVALPQMQRFTDQNSHTLPRSSSKKYRTLTASPSAEPFTVKKRTPTLFK